MTIVIGFVCGAVCGFALALIVFHDWLRNPVKDKKRDDNQKETT